MSAWSDNSASLIIRLFGTFEVRVNGQSLPRLRTRKGQWLLALLVLRHDRDVPREWLAGTLWPESPSEKAYYSLRRCLADLRQAFGAQATRLYSPTPSTLRLDLTDARADVVAFDAAIARGDDVSLENAAGLHSGRLLEDCAEAWALQEREAREQAYIRALETLAERAMRQNDPARAARFLRLANATEPYQESLVCALMRALAAHGNYASARLVFRDFRLLLRQEIGCDPAPEVETLFQELLRDARSRQSRKAATRLAVSASGSVTPLSQRLPRPLTFFIGRKQEVAAVVAHLASARLVSLIGTGGIGKTRMAIQVAEEMEEFCTDGVGFVELAALSEASLVLKTVAQALGLQEEAGRPLQETLLAFLRSRQILLVLDNCEHLIEGSAQITDILLRGCPSLRILATSRQPLGLTGEIAWRVPSLSLPSPSPTSEKGETDPAELMAYEAVCLFVERATAALPAFTLTVRNGPLIAHLCRRLDGIPLAIELAASRVRAMSIEQLVERLEDRFRLLSSYSHTVLPRQQTLRATLKWSYDLLDGAERTLLRRLSVFTGGWMLEAAENVCTDSEKSETGISAHIKSGNSEGRDPSTVYTPHSFWIEAPDVLDLLTRLVDRSLVVCEGQEGGAARYRLFETVRQYCVEERKRSAEEPWLFRRHRDYFLGWAEKANPKLHGPSSKTWVRRLESEQDNLRDAIGWSLTAEGETEMGMRLILALADFWYWHDQRREFRRWLEQALSRSDALSPAVLAQALLWSGNLAQCQEVADWEAARSLFEQSLALCHANGDRRGIADALHGLGSVARLRRQYDLSYALLKESLATYRDLGNLRGIADLLDGLGLVALGLTDYAQAREYLTESVVVWRKTEDRLGLSGAICNLAHVAHLEERFAEARSLYEESLALRQDWGNRDGVSWIHALLADIARRTGDYAQSRSLLEQSWRIYQELGDRVGIASVHRQLGALATDEGDYESARSHYKDSLLLFWEMRNKVGDVALVLEGFHRLASARGEAAAATRLGGALEALWEVIGLSPPAAEPNVSSDCNLTDPRSTLGEEAFTRVWAEGRAMTMEQAVGHVLSD